MNYQAKDKSNSLQHWKYVKRVKKNGKWKYYYDHEQLKDDLGVNDLKEYKETAIVDKRAKQDYKAEAAKEANKNQLDNYRASDSYIQAARNRRKAGKEFAEADKNLRKTPVGKLYFTSKNVKTKVSNFLKKVFK